MDRLTLVSFDLCPYVQRAVIVLVEKRVPFERIDIDLLPPEVVEGQSGGSMGSASMAIMGSPLREAREAFEREYLRVQIKRFSGNISKTAAFVGMERSALHRKLKLLGISVRKNAQDFTDDTEF